MNASTLLTSHDWDADCPDGGSTRRFGDYFGLLRAVPENASLPGNVVNRVAEAAGGWNAETSSFFGFEAAMGRYPVDTADFLFCSFRDEQLAAPEWSRLPAWAGAFNVAGSDSWRRIAEFGRTWLAEASPLAAVDNIWLEFDAPKRRDNVEPSIFFGSSPKAPPGTMADLVQNALPFLMPGVADERSGAVLRVIDALPAEARPFHCGVMLARGNAGVRLMVRDLPGGRVVEALQACGWRGDAANLRAMLEQFEGLYDWFAVGVDVADGVGEAIGLEFHLDRQAKFEPRWEPLMHAAVESAGADFRLADALPRFNGYLHPDRCPVRWPRSLISADPGLLSVMFYFVNHIKVTLGGCVPPSCKAYFGISHRFVDRASLRNSLPQKAAGPS